MKKILLVPFLLLLINSQGYAQDSEQPLTLTIQSGKEICRAGKPMLMVVMIQNVSAEDLVIKYDRDFLFSSGWIVNGSEANLPSANEIKLKDKVLKAGEGFFDTLNMNNPDEYYLALRQKKKGNERIFNNTGKYEISFSGEIKVRYLKQNLEKNVTLVSNVLKLKVEKGEIIEKILRADCERLLLETQKEYSDKGRNVKGEELVLRNFDDKLADLIEKYRQDVVIEMITDIIKSDRRLQFPLPGLLLSRVRPGKKIPLEGFDIEKQEEEFMRTMYEAGEPGS